MQPLIRPLPDVEPYSLDSQLYARQRRRDIRLHLLSWLGGMGMGLLVFYLRIAFGFIQMSTSAAVVTTGVFVTIFIGPFLVSLFRRLKRSKALYSSYQLYLYPDRLVRFQEQTPLLEIRNDEITSIQEIVGKGTIIRTNSAPRFLWIPDELIGYERVKAEIALRNTFEETSRHMPFLYRPGLQCAILFPAFLVVYLTTQPYAALAAATPIWVLMACTLVYGLLGPNTSRATRRQLIFSLFGMVLIALRVRSLFQG